MKRALYLFVVIGLSIAGTDHAVASGLSAARFALPASAFPQPAEIATSRVESNALAAQDDLDRPEGAALASLGRITGYFERAAQPNDDSAGHPHPIVTAYLASVFGTAQQAVLAFSQDRAAWVRGVERPTAGTTVTEQKTASINTGDNGRIAEFISRSGAGPSQSTVSETFFQSDHALVQIWQYATSADATSYVDSASKYVPSIAQRLNAVAKQITVPPAGFQIASLRPERYGSPAGLPAATSSALRVSTHAPVYLSAYVDVNWASVPSSLSARFIIVRAGKTKEEFQVNEKLPAHLSAAYRVFIPHRFRVAGPVATTVRVTIDNVTHARTISFNVSR